MSKIVCLNIPAYGHVNVTLPVVQELLQRGEQVIYYNAEEFRAPIEPTGAEFRPYPQTSLTSKAISDALHDGNMINVSLMLLSATEELLPFVLHELRREQPDLILFDSTILWGKMASRILNIPAVVSHSAFVLDFSASDLRLREIVQFLGQVLPKVPQVYALQARLARRYREGFPPGRPLFPMRGDLNLVYTSRDLQPDTPLIDSTFRFVGPSINPQSRDVDFLRETQTQSPVIYISLGTVHHTRTEFYAQCFEAFGTYPAQFILSAGRDTDIASLGDIPANFIVRPTLPQLEVLQHADVFITHGGINSIHEGLYYGVPQILIPHQLEQMMNARVVAARGAGIVINDQLAHGQVTAARLRGALEEMLASPRYREAAEEIQKSLRAMGGYRQAVDEIQSCITQGKQALAG